jgi:hypothetical protein
MSGEPNLGTWLDLYKIGRLPLYDFQDGRSEPINGNIIRGEPNMWKIHQRNIQDKSEILFGDDRCVIFGNQDGETVFLLLFRTN